MDLEERDVAALIRDALADSAVSWSLGGFGALATFARHPADPVAWIEDGRLGLHTARGGIAFRPGGIRPVAYETAFGRMWSHTIALCRPEDPKGAPIRAGLTELGPDTDAIRPQDRDAILFDAGIGLLQASLCMRSADPPTIAGLRAVCGVPMTTADLLTPILPMHRIALARHGRIEVFDHSSGTSDDDTGIVPRIFAEGRVLRSRRTHAATAPIPAGLVPFAYLHPPHPCSGEGARRIIPERHEAFQAILRRWGDPALVALKSALRLGAPLPPGAGRHERMVAKVVAAQSSVLAGEST